MNGQLSNFKHNNKLYCYKFNDAVYIWQDEVEPAGNTRRGRNIVMWCPYYNMFLPLACRVRSAITFYFSHDLPQQNGLIDVWWMISTVYLGQWIILVKLSEPRNKRAMKIQKPLFTLKKIKTIAKRFVRYCAWILCDVACSFT